MRALGGLFGALAFVLAVPAFAAAPTKPAMEVNSAQKHVSFAISLGETGGFDINGFTKGKMTITVPVGWTVAMKVTNVSDLPHSLEVVDAPKTAPIQALPTAFPKAETADLSNGLAEHQTSSFSFKASRAGHYWMMCGVPGHAAGGMWDNFVVSTTASTPSVSVH